MCGIAGAIATEPLSHDTVSRVFAMNARQVHRGPDGQGAFHEGHVALAMRRLSIIDVHGGQQPLFNEDRSLALVANGEIYNHVELRARLRSQGHHFRTGSDCEVILHLYEEYGRASVDQLRGMFAFALWDRKRRRLLLARDRMGEKPLFLHETTEGLFFASELKALLGSGLVPFELDPHAIDLYFHYQYVPDPLSPVQGVRKLKAGHTLEINLEGPWRLEERSYWNIEDAPPLEGDPPKIIRETLEEVGDITTRSDVPIGVALSGGLDSSIVAAFAARYYPGTLQAFSVGYPGKPPYDERDDARAFANHLRIPFCELEVRADDMVERFSRLNFWRDEPIADISGYGYYAVMELAARQGVRVMLQGQGGDELFWGYPWVSRSVTDSKRKAALRLGRSVGPWHYVNGLDWPTMTPGALVWWLRMLPGRCRSWWRAYWRDLKTSIDRLVFYDLTPDFQIAQAQVKHLYAPQFMKQLQQAAPFELFTKAQPWPNLEVLMTRLACESYLLGNGITQGDRLSMASSVELRLPFLDHRLIETIVGLRKHHSDAALPPKAWLKEAVADLIPAWVANRPKKGFEPPRRLWHQLIFDAYGNRLRDGWLVNHGVLDGMAAKSLASGPFPAHAGSPLSFKALVLETWCREFSTIRDTAALPHESGVLSAAV